MGHHLIGSWGAWGFNTCGLAPLRREELLLSLLFNKQAVTGTTFVVFPSIQLERRHYASLMTAEATGGKTSCINI